MGSLHNYGRSEALSPGWPRQPSPTDDLLAAAKAVLTLEMYHSPRCSTRQYLAPRHTCDCELGNLRAAIRRIEGAK